MASPLSTPARASDPLHYPHPKASDFLQTATTNPSTTLNFFHLKKKGPAKTPNAGPFYL